MQDMVDTVWAILLQRRGLGVLDDLPMDDFQALRTILQTTFASPSVHQDAAESKVLQPQVPSDERCTKAYMTKTIFTPKGQAFGPACVLPLLVKRHGWVF